MAHSSSGGSSAGGSSSTSRSDEWSAARSNVERFDGYLNDLRKYGFGLVTTLLTVTGYLSSSPSTSLPDATRLAVGGAILVLVIALAFLDGQYRSLQRGATIRARILEKYLNLDLTGSMAQFARLGQFSISYPLVYELTAAAVYVVGVGVLWGAWLFELVWIPVFLVAAALVAMLGDDPQVGTVDWSVDAKIVPIGQPVRITFTNLQELDGTKWLWAGGRIQAVDAGYSLLLRERKMRPLFMRDMSWLWRTDDPNVFPGLYKVLGFWYLPPESPVHPESSQLPGSSRLGALREHEDSRYIGSGDEEERGQLIHPPEYIQHVFEIKVQLVGPSPLPTPSTPPSDSNRDAISPSNP